MERDVPEGELSESLNLWSDYEHLFCNITATSKGDYYVALAGTSFLPPRCCKSHGNTSSVTELSKEKNISYKK